MWTVGGVVAPLILASQGLETRNRGLYFLFWAIAHVLFHVVYFFMVISLARGKSLTNRTWPIALAGCNAALVDEGFDFIQHPPILGPIYGTIFVPFLFAAVLLWLVRPKSAFTGLEDSARSAGVSA